ncbi:TPA: hypothetical protein NGT77_004670 [Vibrio parahaemolyticus]|nr:hypothetical protein [Vibrio parahaemolyticus]HCH1634707.1 hypothetical protein [Vibrio parahaemolyticus]
MTNSKEDKLGSGNSSLNHATQRLLGFNRARFDNLEQFNQKVERSLKDPSDTSYKQQLLKTYGELYNHHTSFTQEEQLIDRMGRKAHIRNIFFPRSYDASNRLFNYVGVLDSWLFRYIYATSEDAALMLTRRLRQIRNAWHFRFASNLVFTAQ